MKKKIFSAMLLFAFTLGTTSTFVSCKDYDDEINSLEDRVSALEKDVDQIKSQIASGSVITKTESITNGVRVTLSNEKTFDLLNGSDGRDGTAWTIGSDNYWYKDGAKTDYKATGEDGKDGAYYEPNEDGYFYKVNADGSKEKSNVMWKVGNAAMYAVMDSNDLTLYGLKDADGNELAPVVISLNNNLRSLVFSGDREVGGEIQRVYIDGVPGIRVSSMSYTPEEIKDKDKKSEFAQPIQDAKAVEVRGDVYAYYHVNPSTANIDAIKNSVAYVVKANAEYKSTRATASEDFNVEPEIVNYDNETGILTVKVKTTGTSATSDHISVVALQVTKSDEETVTSDYATIYYEEMGRIRLADKVNTDCSAKNQTGWVDWHYRRAETGTVENELWEYGISKADKYAGNGAIDGSSPVATTAAWVTGQAAKGEDIDIECDYTGSVDLDERVVLHYSEAGNASSLKAACPIADLKALGMTCTYELVQNYKLDANETAQDKFATLNGTVLSANPEYGIAAVGRTPIVRITLKRGDDIVRVAYAKVKFVQKIDNLTADLTPGDGKFVFKCENVTLKSTWEQINKQVYKEVGLSKEEFHSTFSVFDPANNETGNVGSVTETTDTENGETTHVLSWTLTSDDMWHAGKEVIHKVYYYQPASNSTTANPVANKTARHIEITLKATVEGVAKYKNFTTADYTPNYWDAAKTYTKFNVRTPGAADGNEGSERCVFINGLNEPFKLDANGKNAYIGEGEYTLNYYFCADNVEQGEVSVGDYKVKFSLGRASTGEPAEATDSVHLYAQIYNEKTQEWGVYSNGNGDWVAGKNHLIATISNTGETNGIESKLYANVIKFDDSRTAKMLLNTNKLTAMIGLRAYACGDVTTWSYDTNGKFNGNRGKQIVVSFNGEDHFTGKFIRPVNLADAASDSFIDGVNLGQKGSFLPVEDLITPTDWRDYSFVTYPGLYQYYEVKAVAVDTKNAMTDLSTDGSLIKISESAIRDVLTYTPFVSMKENEEESDATDNTGKKKGYKYVIDPTDANKVLGVDGKNKICYMKGTRYGMVYYRNQGNKVEQDFNLYLDITVTYKWGEVIKKQVKVPVAKTIGSN